MFVCKFSDCGSCWAFAALSAVESQKKLWYGTLPALSEQELVDCDYLDAGCNGGWPENAMQYTRIPGVVDETSYPYQAYENGNCYASVTGKTKINDWYYTESTEDEAANWLYYYGPLTHSE